MTFEQQFGKISKKLIKADTSVYENDFAIQITMDDEDCGGTFFVAYIDGAYRVEPYDYVDNNASINVMSNVLEKLIDRKITVEGAVYDGSLVIYGNMNSVIAMFDGFKKAAEKKPAAKKPAAKKAPAKKAPAKKAEEKKVEEKKTEVKKPVEKKAAEKKPVEKKVEEKKAEEKPVVKKEAAPKVEAPKPAVKEEKKPAAKTTKK